MNANSNADNDNDVHHLMMQHKWVHKKEMEEDELHARKLHALNQIPVDSSQVLSLTTSVNITFTSLKQWQ